MPVEARVLCLVGGEFFMLPIENVVDPRVGVCEDTYCQMDGRQIRWLGQMMPP